MANQHFFKPLLPGFHNFLTIPVAFLKNIEGRYEQKTAELKSDASKKIWKVKIDGSNLTDGWKEFALSHDLRIGDIIIFRQESDMSFHVTPLGPSCCEIQYKYDQNSPKLVKKKKKVKKNPRKEAESSSSWVANVTSANLRYDSLSLPMSFVRENGIVVGSGKIVLMNEKSRSWTLELRLKQSSGTTYIRGGWRSFCGANKLKAGDNVTFKLSQRGGTLVLRFSSKEPEEEEEEDEETKEVVSLSTEPERDEESIQDQEERISQECSKRKENNVRLIWKASSSSSQNRFVTVTVTPYNIRSSKLVLPIPFTRVNGIKNAKKMSLLDKHGVKWSTNMRLEKKRERMVLGGVWKEFCDANGVKIGELIKLELIWKADKSSVLKFCSKVMPQLI